MQFDYTVRLIDSYANNNELNKANLSFTAARGGAKTTYAINVADDKPAIYIEDGIADIRIGADNGIQSSIEVAADNNGINKYHWRFGDTITTDIKGLQSAKV